MNQPVNLHAVNESDPDPNDLEMIKSLVIRSEVTSYGWYASIEGLVGRGRKREKQYTKPYCMKLNMHDMIPLPVPFPQLFNLCQIDACSGECPVETRTKTFGFALDADEILLSVDLSQREGNKY